MRDHSPVLSVTTCPYRRAPRRFRGVGFQPAMPASLPAFLVVAAALPCGAGAFACQLFFSRALKLSAFIRVHRRPICVLALACCLFAQQPAPNPPMPANGTARFEANAQLVVETVTVKDKNGDVVKGLTAKDFSITEDGVPQTISFCEFQTVDENPAPPLTAAPAPAPAPPPPPAKVEPVVRTCTSIWAPCPSRIRCARNPPPSSSSEPR